ncbi:MAG: UbiH/UbiF/VisC/COQ6 family ubiquinone biosynthesis hydroxylase [Rickettsiales bacterium]|nr:UbiH/UbiF/VisC/COQ6 family ubiquinone biosynthesis hydroxylase [Rickettsiales bacterium]
MGRIIPTTDIAVIGGGLSGLMLAALLGRVGLQVTVLERGELKVQQEPAFDGRTCAIAAGPKRLFDRIGAWEALAPHAGPIREIRISDGEVGQAASPLFLHFDREDAGDTPMGYIIENRHMRLALHQAVLHCNTVQLREKTECTEMAVQEGHRLLTLSDGTLLQARLVVAADGRGSTARKLAGISVDIRDYHQTAIVCTVKHAAPHHGIAQEHFLPAGPFAILPMHDLHHSSLVWTEKRALVPHFLAMEEAEFMAHLQQRFGDFLGALALVGPRFSYPLTLLHATRYTAPRFCLVGDAAHGIHPIAGQGYNLGLKDIETLVRLIKETALLGLDIGGTALLEAYEAERRPENFRMILATDALNALFANRNGVISLARRAGLAAVHKLPALRRFFVKQAMG